MPLLTKRDAVAWAACFVLVSFALVGLDFTSQDPDSALYADLSARLAAGSPSRWIAPEWWGNWDHEGWFREHPAGVFVVPTILAASGVPGIQAAYIVGIAAGLAALLMTGGLVARVTSRADGRAVLLLLQVIPLASIFRIRANHEYPMLVCLLLALIGADAVRGSWRWIWVIPVALLGALLVKGVFVAVPLIALGAWIVLNPRQVPGSTLRPIAATAAAFAVMALTAVAYDALYRQVTGEPFWAPYWERQLAPLTIATPAEGGRTLVSHAGFYAVRLLWHPAPWSLCLVLAAWRHKAWLGRTWRRWPEGERRGLAFVLLASAAIVLMLIPASRFAERYIFAANHLIAAAGIVVALRTWPRLAAGVSAWDRAIPALPALLWLALMTARLVAGPFLPRISG
jgi:hypothetical protein